MTDRESVIDKIQKLLALAAEEGGGSEGERMAAADKAQKLMLKHNVEMLEVEAQNGQKAEFTESFGVSEKMKDHWHLNLYGSIGSTVNVRAVRLPNILGSKKYQCYTLIGRKDNIEYVKKLGEYLIPALEVECEAARAKQPETNARVFRNNFYQGAAYRIRIRLEERKADAGLSGSGMELIRHDEEALKRHMEEELGMKLKDSKNKGQEDMLALLRGMVAGDQADISGHDSIDEEARRSLELTS